MKTKMPAKGGSASGGKKILLGLLLITLLGAGCKKVILKKEIPTSPKESYEELPK